jgi:hypothetical protein
MYIDICIYMYIYTYISCIGHLVADYGEHVSGSKTMPRAMVSGLCVLLMCC